VSDRKDAESTVAMAAVSPPSESTPEPPEQPVRRSWLPVAAVAVVALLAAAILWSVLRPDGSPTAEDEPSGGSSPKASKSATRTPSPSDPEPSTSKTPEASETTPAPTTSAASTEPTEEAPPPGADAAAMRRFVRSYVSTALADPASAWELLSPRFQQDCCNGEGGYAGYWETIADATLHDVVADPDSMQVSYTITWDPVDRPPEDADVTLVLVRDGDGYLIDQEL
jgi:hypothetical protein